MGLDFGDLSVCSAARAGDSESVADVDRAMRWGLRLGAWAVRGDGRDRVKAFAEQRAEGRTCTARFN